MYSFRQLFSKLSEKAALTRKPEENARKAAVTKSVDVR